MENNEIRSFNVDIEHDNESGLLRGYAIVFNSPTRINKKIEEVIEPQSLNGVLEKSDIFALYEHDKNRGILACSNQGTGTLALVVDDKGLAFEFEAPRTQLGDEVLEMVRRGDINKCSFAFRCSKGGYTVRKQSDGTYLRTIQQFDQLFDISIVSQPAYPTTSVEIKRSIEEIEEQEAKEAREELEQYYKELKTKYLGK